MHWLLPYVGAVSLATLVATVADKAKARRGGARVPERVLLGLALVGGSPGLVLGMALARHKTRKVSFLLPAFGIVLMHAALAYWFLAP